MENLYVGDVCQAAGVLPRPVCVYVCMCGTADTGAGQPLLPRPPGRPCLRLGPSTQPLGVPTPSRPGRLKSCLFYLGNPCSLETCLIKFPFAPNAGIRGGFLSLELFLGCFLERCLFPRRQPLTVCQIAQLLRFIFLRTYYFCGFFSAYLTWTSDKVFKNSFCASRGLSAFYNYSSNLKYLLCVITSFWKGLKSRYLKISLIPLAALGVDGLVTYACPTG